MSKNLPLSGASKNAEMSLVPAPAAASVSRSHATVGDACARTRKGISVRASVASPDGDGERASGWGGETRLRLPRNATAGRRCLSDCQREAIWYVPPVSEFQAGSEP